MSKNQEAVEAAMAFVEMGSDLDSDRMMFLHLYYGERSHGPMWNALCILADEVKRLREIEP